MQSTKWMVLVAAAALAFQLGCGGGSACPGNESFVGNANKNQPVCNGGPSGGPVTAPVYVYSTDGGNQVHAAALTNGTTFAEITGITLPTVPIVTYDMLVVNKKFLYISGNSGSNGEIFGYTIDSSTGSLSTIAGNPVMTSTQVAFSMATDPQGRFLFVGDDGSHVAAFKINSSSGALTTAPQSPYLLDVNSGLGVSDSLTVDNSGTYLYVGQGSGARAGLIFDVFGFNIDQGSGALSPISGEPFALGIGLLQGAPTSPYVLATSDTTNDNQIYSVTVGQGTGILAPIVAFPTLSQPHQVFVHPSGKFVYTIEDGPFALDTVEAFSMDANGNLTVINGSPFTKTDSMWMCRIDQNGNWAFCPTSEGKVAVFGINTATGALSSTIPSLPVNSLFVIAVTD